MHILSLVVLKLIYLKGNNELFLTLLHFLVTNNKFRRNVIKILAKPRPSLFEVIMPHYWLNGSNQEFLRVCSDTALCCILVWSTYTDSFQIVCGYRPKTNKIIDQQSTLFFLLSCRLLWICTVHIIIRVFFLMNFVL